MRLNYGGYLASARQMNYPRAMAGTPKNVLRHLPSIDQLLRRDGLRDLIATAGRDTVRDRLREVLAEIRGEIGAKPGTEDRGSRTEDRLKRNDATLYPRSSILGLS